MNKSNILLCNLSEYRALMYDDGTIRLFYSFPQDISIEDSVIRIGSLQVINRNEICDIIRDDDMVRVKLKNGTSVEIRLEIDRRYEGK